MKNLDDFRSLTKEISAPGSAPSAKEHLKSFIAELRAQDQQERRRMVGMSVVYLSLGLVLAASTTWQSGNAFVGIGIMLVALYFAMRGRWYGRVDYAAPTDEFLATAAKRYQFLRAGQAVYLIPLWLILGSSGGLVVWGTAQRYFGQQGCLIALASYGVFLVAVTAVGLVLGRRQWRLEQAPVLREILKCQREMQDG